MKFLYIAMTFLVGLAAATPLAHDAEAVAEAEPIENLVARQYDPRCPGGCANRARCCGNNVSFLLLILCNWTNRMPHFGND